MKQKDEIKFSEGRCACCDRPGVQVEQHHLIPKTRHHHAKKKFSRARLNETVSLCHPCHRQLHMIFTEKQMERIYHDMAVINEHEDVKKFTSWIQKRPAHIKPLMAERN